MTKAIYTVGYEKASIDDFIATLKHAGIETVIDVREVPLSRKKGFSKTALRALLEANNIEYMHLKGLGDPKEGRDAARSGDYKQFVRIFARHMKTTKAQEDLERAIAEAEDSISCLLCYERKPDECHRTIVAEAISAVTGQNINAIGVPDGLARQQRFVPEYPNMAYA